MTVGATTNRSGVVSSSSSATWWLLSRSFTTATNDVGVDQNHAWPKPVRYSPVRSERSGSAWMEPAKLKRRGLRSSALPAESSFWPTRCVQSRTGLHAVARKLGEQLGVILRDGEVPLLGGAHDRKDSGRTVRRRSIQRTPSLDAAEPPGP